MKAPTAYVRLSTSKIKLSHYPWGSSLPQLLPRVQSIRHAWGMMLFMSGKWAFNDAVADRYYETSSICKRHARLPQTWLAEKHPIFCFEGVPRAQPCMRSYQRFLFRRCLVAQMRRRANISCLSYTPYRNVHSIPSFFPSPFSS